MLQDSSNWIIESSILVAPYSLFKCLYAAACLINLLGTLPYVKKFFYTCRRNGYICSTKSREIFLQPFIVWSILAAWSAALFFILCGYDWFALYAINFFASFWLLLLFRQDSVTLGLAAPGAHTFLCSFYLFFLELSRQVLQDQSTFEFVLIAFRLQAALVVFDAGLSKFMSGFYKTGGVFYAMANPIWCYWSSFYRKAFNASRMFRLAVKGSNHFAYLGQVFGALLLFSATFNIVGIFLITAVFLFIIANFRLLGLAYMVIASLLLFVSPNSSSAFVFDSQIVSVAQTAHKSAWGSMVQGFFTLHLILLALIQPYFYYRDFTGKRAMAPIERFVNFYSFWFWLMRWRVFIPIVTNSYPVIYLRNKRSKQATLYSQYNALDRKSKLRFLHVGESVAMTVTFNSVKYYPGNWGLVDRNVLMLARSIPHDFTEDEVVYILHLIELKLDKISDTPVLESVVQCDTGKVEHRALEPDYYQRLVFNGDWPEYLGDGAFTWMRYYKQRSAS